MSKKDISLSVLTIQPTSSSLDPNVITFSKDFKGLLITVLESTTNDSNIGKPCPMKIVKLIFNKFKGILRIDSIGSRVKCTFDAIYSANYCLSSEKILNMGLCAYIPSTLIYFYGITNLDNSVSEEDFWEDL